MLVIMFKPSIGLVIQGPIISEGLSGKTFGYGKTRVNPNRFIRFDCTRNINDLILNSRKLFDACVLSTWNDSTTLELVKKINTDNLLILPDPGVDSKPFRKPIPGLKHAHQMNGTLRQFTSVLAGAEWLFARDIQYMVKVRTDQHLDLVRLRKEIENFINSDELFFAPYLLNNPIYAIPDFYLAGKTSHLISLCKLMSAKVPRYHESPHRDLAVKSLIVSNRITLNFPLMDLYFDQEAYSSNIKRLFEEIPKIWRRGSRELFSSMKWRGEYFSNIPAGAVFFDEPFDLNSFGMEERIHTFNEKRLFKQVFGTEKWHLVALILTRNYFVKLLRKARRGLSFLRFRGRYKV